MNLKFPFRNLAFNNLHKFYEKDRIQKFGHIKKQETWENTEFDSDIEFYLNLIPNFENEILQVINTCNQETIDYYFEQLKNDIGYFKALSSEAAFKVRIEQWNKEAWAEYRKIIEKNSEKYFGQYERKYGHLEEYETTEFDMLSIFRKEPSKKVKKINHNFYCVEETPNLLSLDIIESYTDFIRFLLDKYSDFSSRQINEWEAGNIKAKSDVMVLKPILFFEGELDLKYFSKACELLGRNDLVQGIEIRQRGSASNLDKLWKILTEDNWETNPQVKILIYDCDTGRPDEEFGHIYRRTIPLFDKNPIKRGIENLLSEDCIKSAQQHKIDFIDYEYIHRRVRGSETKVEIQHINKDEKTNFCHWVCNTGNAVFFEEFKSVFRLIDDILEKK